MSENKEQRGAQSGGDRVQAVMEEHQVSKEALQGPQGPAPKAAEEFEKDMSKASKDLEEKEAGTSLCFFSRGVYDQDTAWMRTCC